MSRPNAWMPLWVADYRADTTRLTLQEHGAYLLLLMDYWRNGPPPDDDEALARILSVPIKDWLKIRPKIEPFFTLKSGRFSHKRVERELAGATERSGKAAAKAKAAADRRWAMARAHAEHAGDDASSIAPSIPDPMLGAMLQPMLGPCPLPVTYSVPTEQAPSPPSPAQEAWQRGTALLVRQGRMKATKARNFLGGLLKDYKLEPADILPTIVNAELKGTEDPQGYLTAAARALAARKGTSPGSVRSPAPDSWGDAEWSTAVRLWRVDQSWSPNMGPEPGEPGCRVPMHLLVEAVA